MPNLTLPGNYPEFLKTLKARIQQSQTRAALAVSQELIGLYWEIGRDLETAITSQNWGAKVLEHLALDLQASFPGVEGFSRANLYRMRAFYQAYPDETEFVAQAVRQLPWGHNIVLLQKLKNPEQRLWYAQQTLRQGWSRNVLTMQIDSKLFERQGKVESNFARTLPPPQSDLAQQILKDPFNFDFLTLGKDAHERELEKGLLAHLRAFILELGTGFALVGNQYHLDIAGKDYYLDLLFYHLKLRCFVVIDLKMGEFKPEYAGKMNFYLAAVDDLLRHSGDNPSIGLILCRDKDNLTIEYALRNVSTPIGISEFTLTEALPKELATDLPTVEQLETALSVLAKEETKNN
jgi:predicted nuclease of restriction endonuclease-like (RecB) superfamily